jgi:hypothetical protein
MGMAGIDPMEFLNTTDPVERAVMLALTTEHAKLRRRLDDQLATNIINRLSKAMGG